MVIVRLGKDGNIGESIYATFLDKVEDALDSTPSLDQVIVDPDHPEWLKYNGGGPFFMCGPATNPKTSEFCLCGMCRFPQLDEPTEQPAEGAGATREDQSDPRPQVAREDVFDDD
jgi:hypothetical protein